jgi:hypothetical protein
MGHGGLAQCEEAVDMRDWVVAQLPLILSLLDCPTIYEVFYILEAFENSKFS